MARTKVLAKYTDYTNVFSFSLIIELFKNTRMNKYGIDLIDGKQLLYEPIYALNPMKLKTSKNYIETYLKTGFS